MGEDEKPQISEEYNYALLVGHGSVGLGCRCWTGGGVMEMLPLFLAIGYLLVLITYGLGRGW